MKRYELQYLNGRKWTISDADTLLRTFSMKEGFAKQWQGCNGIKYRIVQLTETVVYPTRRKK